MDTSLCALGGSVSTAVEGVKVKVEGSAKRLDVLVFFCAVVLGASSNPSPNPNPKSNPDWSRVTFNTQHSAGGVPR